MKSPGVIPRSCWSHSFPSIRNWRSWWRARPNGEQAVYPLVETVQIDGINREVSPRRGSVLIWLRKPEIAHRVADAAEITGIMAVELFATGGPFADQ